MRVESRESITISVVFVRYANKCVESQTATNQLGMNCGFASKVGAPVSCAVDLVSVFCKKKGTTLQYYKSHTVGGVIWNAFNY
jgi:hypothetical protein